MFIEPIYAIAAYVVLSFVYIIYDIQEVRSSLVKSSENLDVPRFVEIDFDTFDKEVDLEPHTVQARLQLNPNKEYNEIFKRAEGKLLTFTLLEDDLGVLSADGKEFTTVFEGVVIYVKGYELRVA